MFVDCVRIFARAGNGGRGGMSFLREKNRPDGGPDGGNGGKGGDVILKVDSQVNNLEPLKYHPHQFAANGQNGMGKQMYGRGADDCIIPVPPGTVVSVLISGDSTSVGNPEGAHEQDLISTEAVASGQLQPRVVADLTQDGQSYILCKGGIGGRGNMHFKSSTNQAPRRYEDGVKGEAGQFQLELKSIADIGLVGYPNAGKSTLLTSLSNARPKIAPYPFTTLSPIIGILEYPGEFARLSVADIPGIIEGAHAGVGLGHDFLRHIERCRLLLFVIDMAGTEGRDPRDDFQKLRKEIRLYHAGLAQRPYLIVANKMDEPAAEENLKIFRQKVRRAVIPISGGTGEGIEDLKLRLKAAVEKLQIQQEEAANSTEVEAEAEAE
ncbi:MAG TPA: GTPase ObgE [Candidatus Methylacidiphilales bacterium]|nr:GTPase ObgE [Candidatus Methylacidiphilales bacterium]